MALPTFGFIFAVPEPPPDLQLPAQHQPLSQRPHGPDASRHEKLQTEDEPPKAEASHQSQYAQLQLLVMSTDLFTALCHEYSHVGSESLRRKND